MKRSIKVILIIIILLTIISFSIILFTLFPPYNKLDGIKNYNKNYFINKYGNDLDSNLSVFPDDKSKLIEATFSSTLQTNLFDTDGYILLDAKYKEDDFNAEIERLRNLSLIISNGCNDSSVYLNKIIYDESSYKYPAYITIDGFGDTYEYALIDADNLKIIYIYLSYPNLSNKKYYQYLKKDKSIYRKNNVITSYSMYNHSFDNGKSYVEFDDCKN